MGCGASQYMIQGHVEPGFEEVHKQFEKMFI